MVANAKATLLAKENQNHTGTEWETTGNRLQTQEKLGNPQKIRENPKQHLKCLL